MENKHLSFHSCTAHQQTYSLEIPNRRDHHDDQSFFQGAISTSRQIEPRSIHHPFHSSFHETITQILTYSRKIRVSKISAETHKELQLWLNCLDKAKTGISINNIIFRSVTSLNLSDSYEIGIGGYGHHSSIGWRYEFTKEEHTSFHINQK